MPDARELHDRLKALCRRLSDFPESSRCEHGVHLKPDAYVAFLDLRQLVEREVMPLLYEIEHERKSSSQDDAAFSC